LRTTDPALRGTDAPLTALYDTALLDLDGVVYLSEEPVPEAAAALAAARAAGMHLEFVTNNASRRPAEVARLLAAVGVRAAEDEVVTSAQAAAALLAEQLPPGARVLVLGTDALGEDLSELGLRPVRLADDKPVAVVQGYSPDTGWRQLAEAAIALRSGAMWVATNTDATVPSPRGPLPGNGSLVAALVTATGRRPDEIVGKPHPRLHQESVRRSGAVRPIVVGDRLDTDIEGAVNAGCDSLLVLTGVTRPADLLAAPVSLRPTYVSVDLRGLLEPHPASAGGRCGGWAAAAEGGELALRGAGEPIDALRALCTAAWAQPASSVRVRPAGDAAATALIALDL
jgi:HAD superfamily hydrolase (TIGR01450 family)